MDDAIVEALRSGKQADEDGVMVTVSRQACEEAAQRIERMRQLLWQYRNDMRYPPAADSKARRIEAINAVLGDR